MESLRSRRFVPSVRLLALAATAALVLILAAAPAGAGSGFSLSGVAFSDTNGNGSLDPGEPGIAGVTIQLDNNTDGIVDSTTLTDGSGNYVLGPFFNTVRVRAVAPAGMVQTSANPADIGAQSSSVNFGFGSAISVPTLDAWGIGALILLCAALAVRHLHRAALARRSTRL